MASLLDIEQNSASDWVVAFVGAIEDYINKENTETMRTLREICAKHLELYTGKVLRKTIGNYYIGVSCTDTPPRGWPERRMVLYGHKLDAEQTRWRPRAVYLCRKSNQRDKRKGTWKLESSDPRSTPIGRGWEFNDLAIYRIPEYAWKVLLNYFPDNSKNQ